MARFATAGTRARKIAAIDFGTTHCSLAYTLSDDTHIVNMGLNWAQERVPTAILLKRTGEGSFTVEKFGTQAQDEISKLGMEQHEYVYFECFKMKLRHEENIRRNKSLKSFTGVRYYLVEVIAFVLCHLKDQLMIHLGGIGTEFSPKDFEWVITVPAIWNARGKQMMREAAYLAGLLSDRPGISRLTPYGQQLPSPAKEDSHKLSLALEPECAAMYCHQLTNDLVTNYSDRPRTAETYMVCDIGGGTVDITTYIKHGEDHIEVISPPTGNACGGRRINEHFCNLLEKIVGDRQLSLFVQKEGKESFHRAILAQVVFHDFENEKQVFGKDASDKPEENFLRLRLHHKFVEFYRRRIIKGVQNLRDDRITFNEQTYTLAIHFSVVKELFQSVIDGVIGCVLRALQKVQGKVDVIYLVGGFGGCRYTYSMLRQAIWSKHSKIPVVVPKLHTLAVSKGAVLYCLNPASIIARRMGASYGICCSEPFKEGVHDEHYAYLDNDDGQKRCKYVFLVFVKKGEKVAITDQFVNTIIPHDSKDTDSTFAFYSTDRDNVQYIVDEHGNYNVKQIGTLTLDTPNPNNIPKWKRTMEVRMDFSSTEIKVQARATYLPGNPSIKAVLDFL